MGSPYINYGQLPITIGSPSLNAPHTYVPHLKYATRRAEQTECRQVPSKFLAVRAFSTFMSCTQPSFFMHTTIYFWHTHTHFLSNSFLYLPRIISMRDMINGLNKKKKRNNSEKLTLLSSYIYNWVLSSTRYN